MSEEWPYPIVRLRHVEVEGDPVSQGSMVAVGDEGAMRHQSGAGLAGWRETIGWRAREAFGAERPWEGPVYLEVLFRLRRPKSVPPSERELPIVPPDVDKLLRAVADALQGIAYVEDKQVCTAHARKRYARPDEEPGCTISLALYGV